MSERVFIILLMAFCAFLTRGQDLAIKPVINYIVTKQKEQNEVRLNLKSNMAGRAYFYVEKYNNQPPRYVKGHRLMRATGVMQFDYSKKGKEQEFTISGLKPETTYRISLLVNKVGTRTKTRIKNYIFSTKNDVDIITRRYKEWCVGNDAVDYDNPIINARYNEWLTAGYRAESALFAYDVKAAGERYDLVNNAEHIKHIRQLLKEVLLPLAMVYHIPGSKAYPNPFYMNKKTLTRIINLYKYLEARGFVTGCKSVFKGGGVYLGLTGYFYASFLMKQELQKANMLEQVVANMEWWTRWELLGLSAQPWTDKEKAALKNSDRVRTFYNNHLITLLTLPDERTSRFGKMALLTDVCNEACGISYGWGGFIKPDFTGYHHHGIWGGAYNTGALHVAAQMSMLMEGTVYKFCKEAVNNLSQAMLAYRFYSNLYDHPKSISGRFPTSTEQLLFNIPAFAYLNGVTNGDYQKAMGESFKRLWAANTSNLENKLAKDISAPILFKGGMGSLQHLINTANAVKVAEDTPSGNRVFPYGNMQIHRRDDWMASVKGYSKYVWDYENNGEQNWFGRNQSAGALEIFATVDPTKGYVTAEASGWNECGYDWDHVPGSTTFDLPSWKDHDKRYKWAKFSPEYFVGGVSLDNNGVFAMKYVDVRETGWKKRDYKLRANKSYFFFDDHIVCLGAKIKSIHPDYPVHTTLFQNKLKNKEFTTVLNGYKPKKKEFALSYKKDKKGRFYMTDGVGNAYFLKNRQGLSITRKIQQSRNNRDKKNTKGLFVKAWIDHGKPDNAKYEYLVWVKGTEEQIKALAKNPDDWYRVEMNNNTAQVVHHVKKEMTGYAIYKPNKVINKGVIYSADSDCLIMHKETSNGIELSVAHPDLGWLGKKRSLYQVWHINDDNRWLKPVEQPVEVTLKGQWEMDGANAAITQLGYDANTKRTRLRFRCNDGASLQVILRRVGASLLVNPGHAESVATEINQVDTEVEVTVYPNPTAGDFSIKLQKDAERVEIINGHGKLVKVVTNLKAGVHPFYLTLSQGTYFIRVINGQHAEARKLLVM